MGGMKILAGEISFYPGGFDDFNGDGGWNDYVELQELQHTGNTFEVPWMIINAGVRLDAVNTKLKYGGYFR